MYIFNKTNLPILKQIIFKGILLLVLVVIFSVNNISTAQAATTSYYCGSGSNAVHTSINFGCEHRGYALWDITFAIIRILSDGVGLIIVASLIVAGIQFSSSSGDPQAVAKATSRIRSTVLALLLFIFGYAILNYLVPGQILK